MHSIGPVRRMGHVLLLAAASVLARSDAVLHRTTTRRHALAALATAPVAAKADEPVELSNGCTYAKVSDGSGPVPKRGDVVAVRLRGLLESGASRAVQRSRATSSPRHRDETLTRNPL
mgnify:CR=1 FL=1